MWARPCDRLLVTESAVCVGLVHERTSGACMSTPDSQGKGAGFRVRSVSAFLVGWGDQRAMTQGRNGAVHEARTPPASTLLDDPPLLARPPAAGQGRCSLPSPGWRTLGSYNFPGGGGDNKNGGLSV